MKQPDRRLIGGVLLALWLASLWLPVAWTGTEAASRVSGADVLLMGWLGMLIGQFGWWGNLLLLGAALPLASFARRPWPRTFVIVSALLLLLALDSWFWDNIPGDDAPHPIIGYGAGYYLWNGVMLASAGWLLARGRGHGRTG